MELVHKLNLNKHPKDVENLSLINAFNVKLSQDESCITNEESIVLNDFIWDGIYNYYGIEKNIIVNIHGIIPSNNELIILANTPNMNTLNIFRYREKTSISSEDIYCAYGGSIEEDNGIEYHNARNFKGAVTYNVDGALILALAMSDGMEDIPLKIINLGKFKDDTIPNDTNLKDNVLSLSPEVNIPKIYDLRYTKGSAYKGWYYLFIRYKINKYDYTQWFDFAYPIYVDTLEKKVITKYSYNVKSIFPSDDNIFQQPIDDYTVGAVDYISNNSDIANETFKFDIIFNESKYSQFQLGFVCASKNYTKVFRTNDLTIENQFNYVLETNILVDYSINDLINDNYNYYNVKNIINYKNRLYISNYKEHTLNKKISQSIIDNINTEMVLDYIDDEGLVYNHTITSLFKDNSHNDTSYDILTEYTDITLDKYLGIESGDDILLTDGTNQYIGKAKIFRIKTEIYPSKINIYQNDVLISDNTIKEKYLDVKVNYHKFDNNYIRIYPYYSVIVGHTRYINTNVSFNNRKLQSTLIPGEVYNFFIHFVDKYGHATNGYRINNKLKWTTSEDSNTEIIPFEFSLQSETTSGAGKLYIAAPINENAIIYDVNIGDYTINTDNLHYFNSIMFSGNSPKLYECLDDNKELYDRIIKNYLSSFSNNKYLQYKWYQIVNESHMQYFGVFINNNNERLFRVPLVTSFTDNYSENGTIKRHTIVKAKFSNITIPDGYVGYFISYEKYEPMQQLVGILSEDDFRTQVANNENSGNIKQHSQSSKMYFYSGNIDMSDKLNYSYDILRVDAKNVFKLDDIKQYNYWQRADTVKFPSDFNKPQVIDYHNLDKGTIMNFAMPEYRLQIADDGTNNRIGIGTALELENKYNLFNIDKDFENYFNLYRVSLMNVSRNIYMNKNKTLIRLSNIIYKSDYNYNTCLIHNGYNGHYTYDGVIVYNSDGVSYNEANGRISRIFSNKEYYKKKRSELIYQSFENETPFMAYFQYPLCTDVFFESKKFKNEPDTVIFPGKIAEPDEEGNINESDNTFTGGAIVTPANSIDLFELPQGSHDMFIPKVFLNYQEDLINIEEYNTTIRRSNILQDESRINNWRTFPLEGYKNITENKGKITNLVGIGTIFLAHTEHSLFMFDMDNTLQTIDKSVQLVQPDIFDVNYKELFTSILGYGGLQNSESYIVGEYGYIWYNNDSNRIYQFDNKQFATIDVDIVHWLKKYKPNFISFGEDKNNNRILINIRYNNSTKNITLSYNYNTKQFISQHNYKFDKAYNTKTNLYMLNKYTLNNPISQFTKEEDNYGHFNQNGNNIVYPSIINIIINNNYGDIKFLEYFRYKLIKYAELTGKDFTNSPVEEMITPFAGNYLTVYNDMINTGKLDINVDSEGVKNKLENFNKPYWDLGNWNFNYLRNKIEDNISADEKSRIFGNYFILSFEFTNEDNRKIEFETLDYKLSDK